MDVNRIFNTVKYMNNRQIIYRFKYEISKRYPKKIKFSKEINKNEKYKFRNREYIPKDYNIILVADKILNNEFTFLNNLTYKFYNEINWNMNPFDYRLWNFNLNYFDFLQILYDAYKIKKDIKYLKKGVELILNWIENNRKYNINTWDPYVVSKRLFNFINFISDIEREYNIEKLDEINYIIATQAQYLNKNIEYYLDANHVIMDGKGLIFSGVYLNDLKLFEKGIFILEEEYKRQILNDGGHYERSPSYQVEVLSHYVECYILLRNNIIRSKSELLLECIKKMARYLEAIIMPNGKIPLLNDSSRDYPFKADDLLQVCSVILNRKISYSNILSDYALSILDKNDVKKFGQLVCKEKYSTEKNIIMKETGYYIIKDSINNEQLYILFDCGDGGPDYNLGHTHADSLNILISLGDKELIIDSGTFTYKIGNDRNRYRSTDVHNTITIDNKNSSDIWGGFRVAKRAKSFIERYEDCVDYTYIRAFHDGYCRVLKNDRIIHKREIVYLKGKGIFIIDTLTGRIHNKHTAVLNYIIDNEIFDQEKQMLFTEKNNIFLNINRSYKSEKSMYSEEFSIEKVCTKIKSSWSFEQESSIITSLMINDNKLEIVVEESKIEVIQDKIEIIRINR